MSQDETNRCRLRIVVLAGGHSAEREVSLASGSNVAAALINRGHQADLLDPARLPLNAIPRDTDIILPMLHGTGAEDGVLQQQLDELDLPWFGTSAESSRLSFDKIATRVALQAAGLPVPPGMAFQGPPTAEQIAAVALFPGFPCVVKPAAQGSSVGISLVREQTELASAIRDVLRWGSEFLIEAYVPGREVTVPVVDGIVFPAVEILPARAWYDYAAKYADESTRYCVAPANLPENLNRLVLHAVRTCAVTAISRTDVRIDPSGICHILEINTIPGMTSHSLVPMSAQSLGISVGELYEELLLKKLGRILIASWERAASLRPPNYLTSRNSGVMNTAQRTSSTSAEPG